MSEKERRCPKCGSSTRERWSSRGARHLESVCNDTEGEDCEWVSEPHEPTPQKVKTTRRVHLRGGGWTYEAFDGRGHIMTSSQSFPTRDECVREAEADVRRATESGHYWGECRAVVWPPSVVVRGELLRGRRK